MNKLTKIVKDITVFGTMLAVSPMAALAQANPNIDLTAINPKWQPLSTITPQKVLVFVINGLLIVAGIVAFLFLIIGGLQWILAGGDKEGTEKSRKKITSALVGLAIVFSAYALAFLVEAIFGISILSFTIPSIVGNTP